MFKSIQYCLILIMFSTPVLCEDVFDKLSSKNWQGKGTLMGAPASFEMSWKEVLNGQFMHLHFNNKVLLKNNKTYTFNAHAYYKIINENEVQGSWFDSRGTTFPLTGKIESNQLTINWGSVDTEQGRTIYQTKIKETVEVIDFVLKDGKYIEFGRAHYQ